ncbi:MAG: hypothetical protein WEB58_20475, partial [Planctomycetaceae bacterium]
MMPRPELILPLVPAMLVVLIYPIGDIPSARGSVRNAPYHHNVLVLATIAWGLAVCCSAPAIAQDNTEWKKHIVHDGIHTVTAVGGDCSGDGLPDVISNSGGKTRLFVAPDWREIILDETPGYDCIHSESFDVDDDGDLDFIGARYSPGLIFWLEQPDKPLEHKWTLRVLDDQLNGIHGLLKGDVDLDGKFDLIANSGQPKGPFHNSVGWLRVPDDSRKVAQWDRFIPALHAARTHSRTNDHRQHRNVP